MYIYKNIYIYIYIYIIYIHYIYTKSVDWRCLFLNKTFHEECNCTRHCLRTFSVGYILVHSPNNLLKTNRKCSQTMPCTIALFMKGFVEEQTSPIHRFCRLSECSLVAQRHGKFISATKLA